MMSSRSGEEAAFVMDLSKKRLSPASVDKALQRLARVLDEEEATAFSGRKTYLARGLELNLSQNALDSFGIPYIQNEKVEITATAIEKPNTMMDMMLMGGVCPTDDDDDETAPPIPAKEAPLLPQVKPLEDRLIKLNLNRNRLGPRLNVSLRDVSRLWRLESLDLSHNGIKSSVGLARLESLRHLYLSHNNLREVEGLSALSKLRILDLSHNQLALPVLRPLAMNKELTELRLEANTAIQQASPEAKRALRAMLTKLRRLSGLFDTNDLHLFAPVDKRHDAYLDLHLRRHSNTTTARKLPYYTEHSKELNRRGNHTPKQILPIQQSEDDSAADNKEDEEDDRLDRLDNNDEKIHHSYAHKYKSQHLQAAKNDATVARRLVAEVTAHQKKPAKPPLTETDIAEARSQLPWRQPPNPIPRWMIEQHVGKHAAKVALRQDTTRRRPQSARATPQSTPQNRPDNTVTSSPRLHSKDASTPINTPLPMPTSIIDALDSIVRYQRNNFHQRQADFSRHSSSPRPSFSHHNSNLEDPSASTPFSSSQEGQNHRTLSSSSAAAATAFNFDDF